MSEMFKQASNNTFNGASFTNKTNTHNTHNTVVTGAKNETNLLLQHCALAALLDSSERMDPARCHPNTRDAIIEKVMVWIEDSNPDASIMIMHGPAGSGKSALAQSIAERCKLQDWLAAAFFFSRTALGRNNGLSLIPTIAYQLMSSHPEVSLPIWMHLRREPTLLNKSIQSVTEDLLVAPFFSRICIALRWITGKFFFSIPRVIVIDGLDECEGKEIQSHILRATATATGRLPQPFRILITCRPEIDIMRTLQEPTINCVELDLGAHNATHDIQLFLHDKFEELKRNHPLAKRGRFPTSWPGSDIIAKIAENASGQFIYASVVMAYIDCSKHCPIDRLNVILGSFPKPDRDAPFDTLDSLYTFVFSSVEDNHFVRQILSLMAIPRTTGDGFGQYTTPAMIVKILSSVSIDNVFLILEQLRSVISLAGPEEPIKFWHASISDFLLDEARSKGFFVNIQMAHDTLARGYLHLFQIQSPNHLLTSNPDLLSFLEHYKRSTLSERLRQDLVQVAYDFFSLYDTAVGEPITLAKLRNAWETERVPKLFNALVPLTDGHSIICVYVDALYRHYPLEDCIKQTLRSFLDSKKSKAIVSAIHEALYVPVLHYLLNCGDTPVTTSLPEKAVIGILRSQSELAKTPFQRTVGQNVVAFVFQVQVNSFRKSRPRTEFVQACNDCVSILLPHASHYSTELVKLLLQQQREFWLYPEMKDTMVGPYLEQFEDHVDAPRELQVFLEKYRASKRPSNETVTFQTE